MARTGRPQKPYRTSWGQDIQGLYHCPDGRWRINATGKKFSESDERVAVARFRQWEQENRPTDLGTLQVHGSALEAMRDIAKRTLDAGGSLHATVKGTGPEGKKAWAVVDHSLRPEQWAWLRQQLYTRAAWVAEQAGCPQLASFATMDLPQQPLKLESIIDTYEKRNPSKVESKRAAVAVVRRLMKVTEAMTLTDLTHDKLLQFRDVIESDDKLQSAGTKSFYYGRIRTVLGFGLKVGLDAAQIRAALDRCKVLWTSEPAPGVSPHPITPEHFHTLLGAGNGTWRPWLLCGLNLCMTLQELCGLQWDWFDLDKGTFCTIREKTRRKRIPRAAMLWKETLEALKALPRKGPYVFTSRQGTRFNRNARHNQFAELRIAAKLPDDVTFSSIRDGAYGAAAYNSTSPVLARVLAGHSAAGYEDNYVLRNPTVTGPACDAVYRVYGPFPKCL